jgi:hypothetical protein
MPRYAGKENASRPSRRDADGRRTSGFDKNGLRKVLAAAIERLSGNGGDPVIRDGL